MDLSFCDGQLVGPEVSLDEGCCHAWSCGRQLPGEKGGMPTLLIAKLFKADKLESTVLFCWNNRNGWSAKDYNALIVPNQHDRSDHRSYDLHFGNNVIQAEYEGSCDPLRLIFNMPMGLTLEVSEV